MTIKTSVHVSARSGSRSLLRRAFTTVVAGCALVIGVASAHAGDTPANSFTVAGTAAAGTMPVEGSGTFEARFQGDKLVLTARAMDQLNMGKRKDHTVKEFGFKDSSRIKVSINKADLKIPEAGKEVSGTVPGEVTINGLATKTTKVNSISYTVKEVGGKYVFKANFTFDYTPHSGGKEICFLGKAPCVAKDLKITATGTVSK